MTHQRIVLETVSRHNMRKEAPGVGDWFIDADGSLIVRVCDEVAEPERFLILLHELIEVTLCAARGITQKEVDDFDIQYEIRRAKEGLSPDDEPGDDPTAPYRREHRFSMLMEHLMARELGIPHYGLVR